MKTMSSARIYWFLLNVKLKNSSDSENVNGIIASADVFEGYFQ